MKNNNKYIGKAWASTTITAALREAKPDIEQFIIKELEKKVAIEAAQHVTISIECCGDELIYTGTLYIFDKNQYIQDMPEGGQQ